MTDLQEFKITKIAAGWNHSLALTERGGLFATGHGEYGQLGTGDTELTKVFTLVNSIGNKNIELLFAGGNHSWIVLDQDHLIRIQPKINLNT